MLQKFSTAVRTSAACSRLTSASRHATSSGVNWRHPARRPHKPCITEVVGAGARISGSAGSPPGVSRPDVDSRRRRQIAAVENFRSPLQLFCGAFERDTSTLQHVGARGDRQRQRRGSAHRSA